MTAASHPAAMLAEYRPGGVNGFNANPFGVHWVVVDDVLHGQCVVVGVLFLAAAGEHDGGAVELTDLSKGLPHGGVAEQPGTEGQVAATDTNHR
ncbi:hypothetical protein, partial [Mycobacteroides abscessus]|uniref:hypothetical protein n=1 Tax=Mycobacteroides abscessus TaxID=36809 RepID=UPI001041FEB0